MRISDWSSDVCSSYLTYHSHHERSSKWAGFQGLVRVAQCLCPWANRTSEGFDGATCVGAKPCAKRSRGLVDLAAQGARSRTDALSDLLGQGAQIGRAACRERGWSVRVDIGGLP